MYLKQLLLFFILHTCATGVLHGMSEAYKILAPVRFVDAIKNSYSEFIKSYLQDDPDAINRPDSLGFTPLFYAPNAAIAQLLVEQGANLLYANQQRSGAQPLHYAALHDRSDIVEYLITGAGVPYDTEDDNGVNVLWYAVRGNALCTTAYLLSNFLFDYNFDLSNQIEKQDLLNNETIMHRARSPEMIDLLASFGVPLNGLNQFLLTPVQVAAKQERYDLVQALINNHASLFYIEGDHPSISVRRALKAMYANNPLLLAVLEGDIKQVQKLIASEQGFFYYSKDLTQALIDASTGGLTPLVAAVGQNAPLLVAFLIAHGADTTVRDQSGRTLQQIAEYTNNHYMIELLDYLLASPSSAERELRAARYVQDLYGDAHRAIGLPYQAPDSFAMFDIRY